MLFYYWEVRPKTWKFIPNDFLVFITHILLHFYTWKLCWNYDWKTWFWSWKSGFQVTILEQFLCVKMWTTRCVKQMIFTLLNPKLYCYFFHDSSVISAFIIKTCLAMFRFSHKFTISYMLRQKPYISTLPKECYNTNQQNLKMIKYKFRSMQRITLAK